MMQLAEAAAALGARTSGGDVLFAGVSTDSAVSGPATSSSRCAASASTGTTS